MNDQTLTPTQLFEHMPAHFQVDKAGHTTATYQFNLSGEGGGQWWLRITTGTATSGEGIADNPDVTLSSDAHNYVKIALGTMNPTMAFMQGKLKIKGDMGLAMKMQAMFKRPT